MENLIKPVDYAAKMGISRQAVYAKIKKGILASKNIGGKIYVILDDNSKREEKSIKSQSAQKEVPTTLGKSDDGHKKLLQAKDETITILKETITDLKDTNKMIVTTMRGEVDLLKDAFGEMKMLYRLQLEEKTQEGIEGEKISEVDDEVIEVDDEAPYDEKLLDDYGVELDDKEEWVELDEFFALHKIKKIKKQKKIKKYFKSSLKKGDPRVDIVDGNIIFLANSEFEDMLSSI